MSVRLAWVCALVVVSGCGSKQPAKPPAPLAVEPTATVAEEPPDLSPVARPADVIAIGRVARPRLLVETLAKWTSAPLDPSDVVPREASVFAPVLLWDAPIEAVAALDPSSDGQLPETLEVASVGLKSLPEALSAADRMQLVTRRLAPGVWRVGELSEGSCALAASVGPAPARLVCGKSSKDVDALLPYATRGLPTEPQSGADLELTLDAAPVQARYGTRISALRLFAGVAMREVALDSPRFDRAVSDAIYGGIDEAISLFGDLQQIRLEARLDAARNVLATSGELRLKGDASWVAGTLAANKPVPVPATLPRLPPGTSSAWFSAAMPPERYVAINRVLGDLAEGYLEHEKLPDASRKRVRKALEPWLQKMPETFAFTLPARAAKAGSAAPRSETTISRLTEPSATVLSRYAGLLSLLEDRPFKRWVQEKTQLSDKAWPKLTKKQLKLAGFKTPATLFEVTTDPKLWTGSSTIVRNMVDKWLPLTQGDGRVRLLIVVQPDGTSTYVCWGETSGEIEHAMAEHRKSEPGAFFARPARSEPVGSAGFFTIAGIARAIERSNDVAEVRRAISAAPHRGETAIPFSTASGPGSARFDLELPAAALADIVAMAMGIGGGVLEKRSPAQPLQ